MLILKFKDFINKCISLSAIMCDIQCPYPEQNIKVLVNFVFSQEKIDNLLGK